MCGFFVICTRISIILIVSMGVLAAPLQADVVRSISLGTPSYIGAPSTINGTLDNFFGPFDYRVFYPENSGDSALTAVMKNSKIAVHSATGIAVTVSGDQPFAIPGIQYEVGISYSDVHLRFPEGIRPFADAADYRLKAIEMYGEAGARSNMLTNNRFDVFVELGIGASFGLGHGLYESALIRVENTAAFQVPYSFARIEIERGNLGIVAKLRLSSENVPEITSQIRCSF